MALSYFFKFQNTKRIFNSQLAYAFVQYSAKVETEWSYCSISLYAFLACRGTLNSMLHFLITQALACLQETYLVFNIDGIIVCCHTKWCAL